MLRTPLPVPPPQGGREPEVRLTAIAACEGERRSSHDLLPPPAWGRDGEGVAPSSKLAI